MLVTGFPAGSFGTNCWIVAPGDGAGCLIVDPGEGAWAQLPRLLAAHGVSPVAVLLTHGHVDHTFDLVEVCAAFDIPAYLHPADRAQLRDPQAGLGLAPGTELFGRSAFAEPVTVLPLAAGQTLELAGLVLRVDSTPGHTPGSVCFSLAGAADGTGSVLLSGDTLFRDAIGRMDLPGSDELAMVDSIRRVLLALPDAMAVHPGHGETTTIGRERAQNPFLAHVANGGVAFSAGASARRGL